MVDYKEEATDGDDDGMVQDATPFERPIGTKIVNGNVVPAVLPEGEKIIPEKYIVKDVTCVMSSKKYYLPGVGRLVKGKNEIKPEHAAIWLNLDGVEAC
jgi:hypothetical protein